MAGGPRFLDVVNPSTGAVISRVPLGGRVEVEQAVVAARAAFPAWAATPIKERVQVFYRGPQTFAAANHAKDRCALPF